MMKNHLLTIMAEEPRKWESVTLWQQKIWGTWAMGVQPMRICIYIQAS